MSADDDDIDLIEEPDAPRGLPTSAGPLHDAVGPDEVTRRLTAIKDKVVRATLLRIDKKFGELKNELLEEIKTTRHGLRNEFAIKFTKLEEQANDYSVSSAVAETRLNSTIERYDEKLDSFDDIMQGLVNLTTRLKNGHRDQSRRVGKMEEVQNQWLRWAKKGFAAVVMAMGAAFGSLYQTGKSAGQSEAAQVQRDLEIQTLKKNQSMILASLWRAGLIVPTSVIPDTGDSP